VAQQSPAHIALGRAVRDLRGRLGISQEELADRTGLNRTYVGDVERGTRNLGFRALLQLAAGLDVRASELVARSEELEARR
jgi:transcriptional regulator with XRE-family HTH domain